MRIVTATAFIAAAVWLAAAEGLSAADVTVSAGDSARPAGPLFWKPDRPLDKRKPYCLVGAEGDPIPAQVTADGRLCWWSPAMGAGATAAYKIEADVTPRDHVRVSMDGDAAVRVAIDGKPFTTFLYGKELPKPFLYPVIGPTGEPVTRDYPMKDNALEREAKRQDHPHHRSIWTAHGDVRTGDFSKPGHNYWNEVWEKEKKDGLPVLRLAENDRQIVRRVARPVSGPVFGQIEADIDWVSDAGERQLTETRTYTFYRADGDARVIDIRIVFRFPDGDVMFADTKEGGLVSVRLAVTMDEQGAAGKNGQMRNARGQVGEKAAWGKPAEWCDYCGPVGNTTVGVAIFDHPANFRHPTTWHIRGYGLYTANPFGLKDFTGDKNNNGSHVWKKGESAEFNYRIVIHKGDTKAARIAEAYRLYADPPRIAGR